MIVRDDDEVVSDSSYGETFISSESKSHGGDSHVKGDVLMVKRLIRSQMVEEAKTLRENNFYYRCHILGNLCSIIIDESSYVTVASERLVKKLALPTLVHPRPYRLQWLSEHGELVVNQQVEVAFTLGRVTNRFTFVHMGQKVVLKPLSSRTA
ncbi:hypothetical protein CR513_01010, partial [Mucuna pruriens]